MDMSKSKRVFAWLGSAVLAAIATTLLASIISSQRVMGPLVELGAELGADISLSDRLLMTAYDARHFGSLYGVFVITALMIAFAAGGLVYRFAKTGRMIVYMIAGSVAMLVMLSAMEAVFFGVPIVGGARSGVGIALQVLAGAVGGAVFAQLTRPRTT